MAVCAHSHLGTRLTTVDHAHIDETQDVGFGLIGKRAFIGSDTMLVAPVSVGDDALTASGSVITEDVPAEAVALGRAKQVNKAGLATKLFERLRAIKAAKGKS